MSTPLQGFIDQSTGEVQLEFDAEFNFTAPLYKVRSILHDPFQQVCIICRSLKRLPSSFTAVCNPAPSIDLRNEQIGHPDVDLLGLSSATEHSRNCLDIMTVSIMCLGSKCRPMLRFNSCTCVKHRHVLNDPCTSLAEAVSGPFLVV